MSNLDPPSVSRSRYSPTNLSPSFNPNLPKNHQNKSQTITEKKSSKSLPIIESNVKKNDQNNKNEASALISWLKDTSPPNCTPLLCHIQTVTPIHSCVELLLRQMFRSRILCVNEQGIYVLDELTLPKKFLPKNDAKSKKLNLSPEVESSIVMSHFSPDTCICSGTDEFLIDFDRRLLHILPRPKEFEKWQKQNLERLHFLEQEQRKLNEEIYLQSEREQIRSYPQPPQWNPLHSTSFPSSSTQQSHLTSNTHIHPSTIPHNNNYNPTQPHLYPQHSFFSSNHSLPSSNLPLISPNLPHTSIVNPPTSYQQYPNTPHIAQKNPPPHQIQHYRSASTSSISLYPENSQIDNDNRRYYDYQKGTSVDGRGKLQYSVGGGWNGSFQQNDPKETSYGSLNSELSQNQQLNQQSTHFIRAHSHRPNQNDFFMNNASHLDQSSGYLPPNQSISLANNTLYLYQHESPSLGTSMAQSRAFFDSSGSC